MARMFPPIQEIDRLDAMRMVKAAGSGVANDFSVAVDDAFTRYGGVERVMYALALKASENAEPGGK